MINQSVAIPCTGCSYCINKCPINIAIPKYFALYNADMRELETKAWTAQTMLYSHFSEQYGKAGDCIRCGQCEKICPQHLPIREWMKRWLKDLKETRVIPELKNPTRYVRIDKNYVGGLKDMEQYKQEFIEFMVESDVLKFGEFTLKSGRKSPFL